jgi:hypothetical protein
MNSILRLLACLAVFVSAVETARAADGRDLHTFKKTQLSDQFFSEGATFADVDHDGAGDVIAGPFWYAGPKYLERHEYYPAKPFNIDGYSEDFLEFAYDFNRDGWADILVIGFPGKETSWYENPQNKPGHWKRHIALAVTDNESPMFTDVTGDGQPDLVCMTEGQIGLAEIPAKDPTQPWKFTAVSPKRDYQRFTHGIGVGDVNGDGRQDLLEKDGWWEQPAKIVEGQPWKLHEVKFSEPGGSQMFAYDFDFDGDNDVVTAKAAHAYGLAWFENTGGEGGEVAFVEHKITGERPEENDYGVAFSQLHALDVVDVDGDGVKDIVTGKRWWAHSQHDPGSLEPAVLYWFQTVRDGGTARFVPHLIDDNSGVGTQVTVGDVNGDKLPDVVVGNKKGVFIHTHKVEKVDEATWQNAQPKRRDGASAETPKPDPAAADAEGFPAVAEDGRPLNLDFETGDLADWTVHGNAFQGQPTEGDTVHARRDDSESGHRGKFWVGSFERDGDGPQGTLESVPFKVSHPYASFLVGGGAGNALGAEIVRRDTGEVVFRASGRATEKMQLAVADLRTVLGKDVFVRVVDRGSAGWGHTNFDDFRFHDLKPAVEEPPAGERRADDYPYAGLPGEEAVRVMKLPEGFKAILFAAEPDVKQPIAMALDHRGRLWVAEAYEYPVRAPEG